MISIRKRISRPFLLLIVLIPIAIFVIFNLIVSFFNRQQAEQDLQVAVSEISQNIDSGDTQFLINLVRSQSHTSSAELVVFNRNGELSRLFDLRDSFITEQMAIYAYSQVEDLDFEQINSFRFENEIYYAVKVDYQANNLTDMLVYISKGLVIDDFVVTVNIVLLSVSAVVTAIAIWVSTRVANSIARPIEVLTTQVEAMKSDEIVVIDNKSDSFELSRLTAEINALNRRVYHYNQSQKNFLHNASHELRTPLMSIQGYADGIEMGVFTDAKGTAHLISDQSKRLTKLVDGLLTLARAENFNPDKKFERLNITSQLLELVDQYKGYAISKGISVTTDIAPNVFTKANSELLSACVGNVVSNAIRYAKQNVSISLETHNENIVITVRDDGAGVENIDHIFDRFAKGVGGNFGLGLSIAKTSIEMLSGKIEAYNDGGAVFELTLPLQTI